MLSQGINIVLDFYQDEMVKLSQDMDHIKFFLDDRGALDKGKSDRHV